MSAHTPGPWEAIAIQDGIQAFGIIAQRQPTAIQMNDIAAVWLRGGPAKSEANARLIAAAPDLLAALINAEKWINEVGKWPGRRAIADAFLPTVRAAIAKATEAA